MRSLGRPNREQVVTTRPAEMTTLEAIEMSNGQPLAELLRQGRRQLLARAPGLVEPRNVRAISFARRRRGRQRTTNWLG